MPDVSELAERALEGDRASFDALFDRLFTPIAAYAHGHCATSADAERVIEEALVEILGTLEVSEPDLMLRSFEIVRRRTTSTLRSPARAVRTGAPVGRTATNS